MEQLRRKQVAFYLFSEMEQRSLLDSKDGSSVPGGLFPLSAGQKELSTSQVGGALF